MKPVMLETSPAFFPAASNQDADKFVLAFSQQKLHKI
jgi:hypothetical protein